jgi:hypothetical protein
MQSSEIHLDRPAIEQDHGGDKSCLEEYRLPGAAGSFNQNIPTEASSGDIRALGFPNMALEDDQLAQEQRRFNRGTQPRRTPAGVEWDAPDGSSRTLVRPDGSRLIQYPNGMLSYQPMDLI